MADPAILHELRTRFVELMTVDGDTTDRRRKGYNQAIFNPQSGTPIWVPTDGYLWMVLEKFDRAVKEVSK